MPTWTSTLPQDFLKGSYQETAPDMALSFKADFGPPLTRKRGVGTISPFSGDMHMTDSQKTTFIAFWEDYCSSAFNFPYSGGVPTIFTAPPQYSDTGLWQGSERLWRVKLQMARLP